ncbi:MAG TPA: glycoside hydrolase family 9 protein [Anaerolineae bacterium]|nr:glycoside hydrolase family 9 protein [Anaerolineae bacterium]
MIVHAQGPAFNYGEALQKAIFFYEAQIAGAKPSWSRVEWRGDAMMTDGQDVGRDLTGGWFDAGDHVKFGFPMASSATMLAWGGVEYRTAYANSGQLTHLLNNLRVVNDYFIKAHPTANELYVQVGDGNADHTGISQWAAAEVKLASLIPRPSFKIDLTCKGTDVAAETAAAMAASSMVFRPTDATYANTLLSHARQLFALAEATKGTDGKDSSYANCLAPRTAVNFYDSRFGVYWDELAWASVWLYRATGEAPFLQKARDYYPLMGTENQTTTPSFRWTQGWNDKAFGTYVLMAKLTNEAQFKTDAQRWLDYWSVPTGGGPRTAGGLIIVDPGGWGELRYAANTAFVAFVYADFLGSGDTLYSRYHNFAAQQINYALGANPLNRSFVVGFGNNPPQNPHHRGAHGSWANNMNTPTYTRHILYGALVGGPENTSDSSYNDSRDDFVSNEVATDYNAGFTGALARMYQEFGGTPLANFPQPETRDDNELYIEASVNASGANFTEIKSFITNKSSWPARILNQGTLRYFFTLEPGVTPSMLTLTFNFNQCGGGGTGPTQWSGNIYYVTASCAGTSIYPGGQSEYRKEIQFRIASSGAWDASNDWSFAGVPTTPGSTPVTVNNIVLYNNGVRVWGNEPPSGGTNTPTATPTRTNTPTPTPTQGPSFTPTNTPTPSPTQPTGSNDTGWVSPSNQAAQTGGDGNGFQTSPTAAFADGGTSIATDTNSGTNTNTSCTNTGKDRHAYFAYPLSIPGGSTITGIEVRLDARVDSATGTRQMCVEVSWNNGATWTAVKTSAALSTTEASYILGSATDTWGRAWTTGELTSANFRVRITNVSNSTSRDFFLDWAPVRVTYTGGGVTNTPTPTPTRTNTPTPTATGASPTPTPTSPPGNVRVQLRGNGNDNTTRSDFAFRVQNTGASAQSNITVRVYFTLDGSQAASSYALEKWYDQSNVATVSGPTLASGTTYYFTVNYGTASLAAGASWEFQTTLHLSNWSANYSGTNDWWHNTGTLPTAYTDWTRLPAYVNGVLAWGSTP